MSPRMLVVLTLMTVHSLIANGEMMASEYSLKLNVSECLHIIIKRYFNEHSTINYVKLDDDDDDDQFLHGLHSMKAPVALVKWPYPSENSNKGYIIYVGDELLFDRANYLIEERYWNPYAQFIIILKQLQNVRKVLNILLGLRIYNVVVVNGTNTAELYSYNAFENNACGNYYTDIISYGKCFQGFTNLYENKRKSLRNCFLRITVAHTPPFTIDPALNDDEDYVPGVEEYIAHLFSRAEYFNYNFSYNVSAEDFSSISKNMTVTGPLKLLQNNETDMFLGGRFLLRSRARRFSYIHGYFDCEDSIATVVKRATVLPPWKDFYRGFSYGVWLLILLCFIVYLLLLILLFKPNDKGHVVMVLLDNLFQHGSLLKSDQPDKVFLIIFVWFAYLLNCCFSSTLVGLIRKPNTDFQLRNDRDFRLYGFKSCMSLAMVGYFSENSHNKRPANSINSNRCMTLMESLTVVSENDNIFTAIPYSMFAYNGHLLKDQYGQSPVYLLDKPFSNLIYAIYVSKGFPLVHKLMIWTLRFKASGLIEKHMSDIVFWRGLKYNKYRFKEFESRVAVPWLFYATGVFLSLVAFLCEVALKYSCRRHVEVDTI